MFRCTPRRWVSSNGRDGRSLASVTGWPASGAITAAGRLPGQPPGRPGGPSGGESPTPATWPSSRGRPPAYGGTGGHGCSYRAPERRGSPDADRLSPVRFRRLRRQPSTRGDELEPLPRKIVIECECVRDSPLAHERDARPVREADPAARRRKERRHRAVKQTLVDPGHLQERKQVAIQDSNRRDPDSGLQQGDGLENDERRGHETGVLVSQRWDCRARRFMVFVGFDQQCEQRRSIHEDFGHGRRHRSGMHHDSSRCPWRHPPCGTSPPRSESGPTLILSARRQGRDRLPRERVARKTSTGVPRALSVARTGLVRAGFACESWQHDTTCMHTCGSGTTPRPYCPTAPKDGNERRPIGRISDGCRPCRRRTRTSWTRSPR